jgi:hypothetical protein
MASEARPIIRSFAERFDLDRVEDDRPSRSRENCIMRFMTMKKFCFMCLMLILIFFLDLAELAKSLGAARSKTEEMLIAMLNSSSAAHENATLE